MAPDTITSSANPIVKSIAALAQKKYRDAEGLFVLEGMERLNEALANGWELHNLLHVPEITAEVAPLHSRRLLVSLDVLAHITKKDNPQPVLAVVKQRRLTVNDIAITQGRLVLVLDRIRDPGNLGTILRTAEACGVAAVVLAGDCVDEYAPDVVRASMGSLLRVPVVRATEAACIAWLTDNHVNAIATHLHATVDFADAKLASGTVNALLMGNESAGLTDALTACAQNKIRIPMHGEIESLNVATATAVMLYQLVWQR